MNNHMKLYEGYKKARLLEDADLNRFEGRLSHDELEELKSQILYLVLEAEEEAFLSALELKEFDTKFTVLKLCTSAS